ncbi:PepSY-associated TM helix domain-containing protein [Oceanobacillus kapialis]|uniref:PepSY-associated TM helix domain-containing protein n=1 Tax=Oceanobacillus kapialis TaxID=481353 RepID=A0ABW5Q307_9BACI
MSMREKVVQPASKERKSKQKKAKLYKTVWRWHFYAGLIIAPFLLILAVTGSIYLFKPQIENVIYADYYDVTPQDERLADSEILETVRDDYPGATVTSFRPGEDQERSSEVGLSYEGESLTVFVNPYTGEQLRELNAEDRIMDKIEEFHGELMAGTLGDRIVELAASWGVVLIVTGIFLWFPRKRKSLAGVLYPRFHKGKMTLRRDLHAVPAFWIAAGMLFLIMTGLPWSGFWGTNFQTITTNAGVGYPPSVWVGDAPSSGVETQEIADVPWAAETLDVPKSDIQGLVPVSIDDITATAEREGVHPSYTVIFPSSEEGVFTLSAFPPKAKDEITMHLDQYSGAVLADYRYDNYEPIGKLVAWGITLHKGTEFGFINQLISLAICLGIILIVLSGFYLWWKRKPKHGTGAPKSAGIFNMKLFLVVLIALGIIFPLVGLSIIFILLIDILLIKRIPALHRFFNA